MCPVVIAISVASGEAAHFLWCKLFVCVCPFVHNLQLLPSWGVLPSLVDLYQHFRK